MLTPRAQQCSKRWQLSLSDSSKSFNRSLRTLSCPIPNKLRLLLLQLLQLLLPRSVADNGGLR